MSGAEKLIIRLSKTVLSIDLRQEKSIFCSMVLRLMDTAEFSNDYCNALNLVLELFPEVDREKLEKELNAIIKNANDIKASSDKIITSASDLINKTLENMKSKIENFKIDKLCKKIDKLDLE